MWHKAKDLIIREAFQGVTNGGALIIADTKAQLYNKACKHIDIYRGRCPEGLWVLVVDEADAMFRTPDRRQVFEQALQRLMIKAPCLVSVIC